MNRTPAPNGINAELVNAREAEVSVYTSSTSTHQEIPC